MENVVWRAIHLPKEETKWPPRTGVLHCVPPLPDRTQNRGVALRVFRWQRLEAFVCTLGHDTGVRRTRHEPKEGGPIEPRQHLGGGKEKKGGPAPKATVSNLYGTVC